MIILCIIRYFSTIEGFGSQLLNKSKTRKNPLETRSIKVERSIA